MRVAPLSWRKVLPAILLSLAPVIYLEALRFLAGAPFSLAGLAARGLFTAVVLLAAAWSRPHSAEGAACVWPWPGLVVAVAGGAAGLIYALTQAAGAAWVFLSLSFAILLALDRLDAGGRSVWRRWGARAGLVLLGAAVPVAIEQVRSHFAEEEFLSLLAVFSVAGYVSLLILAGRIGWRNLPLRARPGLRVDRSRAALLVSVVALLGAAGVVRAYQYSFYPSQAPSYPGISAATPFLCGEVPASARVFDGRQVYQQLLDRVADNPAKGVPEFGMLALGSGERQWAEQFHAGILREADQMLFTGPANSVKFAQSQAALRAYYYPRVRDAFPDLFTAGETQTLREWFAAINRRALTVEWVDWLYAVAYAKWPEGPYENQENGAGLLALLEHAALAAPELSPANQRYLDRDPRGWAARFRNTDDTFLYQSDWLRNAYFQSLYTGQAPPENVRLSFEWLLIQTLPDGRAPRYNHPASPSLAGVAYLGARLLEDARFVWLSARALNALDASQVPLGAQPGAEQPVDVVGGAPTQGSCLVYGGSGLPNQTGPLAPDKIVFRDGWADTSSYLLLNLRFTGWHRYKATNTLSQFDQAGPLVVEKTGGERLAWLPAGRQLFRDKRVPRENLNGLLIERSGMGAVLYALIGFGGPWAQDPPFYARVERFELGDQLDVSSTVLDDWHGWQHRRTIYFYHTGPIVIVDDARGPARQQSALIWHVVGQGVVENRRITLRDGESPAEMLVLPIGPGQVQVQIEAAGQGDSGAQVMIGPVAGGRLSVATVFLLGEWAGARADIHQEPGGPMLRITRADQLISIPLLREGEFQEPAQP